MKPSSGAAEALAAILRETGTGLILGGTTVYNAKLADDGSEIRHTELKENDPWARPATELEADQVAWLEAAMQSSDAKWKFLLAHHPVWSSSGNKFEQGQALRRLLNHYLGTADHARRFLRPARDELDFASGMPQPERAPRPPSQKMNPMSPRKTRTHTLMICAAYPSAGVAADALVSRMTSHTCQCWRIPLRANPMRPMSHVNVTTSTNNAYCERSGISPQRISPRDCASRAINTSITLGDVDSANMTGATVTITDFDIGIDRPGQVHAGGYGVIGTSEGVLTGKTGSSFNMRPRQENGLEFPLAILLQPFTMAFPLGTHRYVILGCKLTGAKFTVKQMDGDTTVQVSFIFETMKQTN